MKNYFSVFNLQPSFELDTQALEKAYFNAQRLFHPDRLVGKGPMERQQAVLQSMLVNEAYEALKQPLDRARHMLALKGVKVGSEQDSVKPATSLLMEIMESREALAEASSVEAVTALETKNAKATKDSLNALSGAFDTNDLSVAAQHTIRLGYLIKMDDEIRVRKKGLAA